ncbi:MICOS complex subunit MIC13 isoform X3 [Neoarius graeffei]|uniref:MICOS complex subunit MIC13 isoform X3 n=1 Tax=Neoarius graeffei TaxID=443677 RepID=UPI00298CECBD|nr:MICOS complex subunit MIC13 isoform X3 [Neoarius graeffei]
MAAKMLPVVKLATKVGIAGGAMYVAYDSGLLSGSAEGSEALNKAKAAIPPAVDEWTKYFGLELPAAPKIEFSPGDAWNSEVERVDCAHETKSSSQRRNGPATLKQKGEDWR